MFTFRKEFQSMGFAFPILRNKTHTYERKKIVRQSLLTNRKWKTGRAKNSSQRRTSIHEYLPSPISTRGVWRICFSVLWPKKPEQTEQHWLVIQHLYSYDYDWNAIFELRWIFMLIRTWKRRLSTSLSRALRQERRQRLRHNNQLMCQFITMDSLMN